LADSGIQGKNWWTGKNRVRTDRQEKQGKNWWTGKNKVSIERQGRTG
jgi:hypothetical protein